MRWLCRGDIPKGKLVRATKLQEIAFGQNIQWQQKARKRASERDVAATVTAGRIAGAQVQRRGDAKMSKGSSIRGDDRRSRHIMSARQTVDDRWFGKSRG